MKKTRLVAGVGINDSTEITWTVIDGKKIRCPFYVKWKAILQRCYNENQHQQRCKKGYLKNAAYIGCSISDEWIYFTKFKSWMEKQDWEGNHLDKDLLVPGNKVYGPDTCIFVPPHINYMLIDQKPGKYKKGVTFDKKSNLYHIKVVVNGKQTTRGCWKTEDEAAIAFMQYKYREFCQVAETVKDPKLKKALYQYAKNNYEFS